MDLPLGTAKAEARALRRAGDFAGALDAYDRLLAAAPLDHEARLHIADVLAAAGREDDAAEVYRTVALHDVRSGHPLPALVACHALAALGRPAEELLALLAQTYGAGSPHLARFAVRPAPLDPATMVTLDPPAALPVERAADRARKRALDLSVYVSYQQQYHPIPFLSDLSPDALYAVMQRLAVRRLEDGAAIVRQGEPGTALYLVAAGQVRVSTALPDGSSRELARLFENALFGEMALLTAQPRAASVAAEGEADVVEVSRDLLTALTAQLPGLRDALDRFARERLIRNLLASSPLFRPFTKEQQAELLRRFEGTEVAAGAEVIRQGEPGAGLYVVLSGALEVTAVDASGRAVALGTLGTGDICGEMSLLTQQPTSATVRALRPTTLLFLARAYVERLADAIPEVQAYFEDVTARRLRDNSLRLGARHLPDQPIELDASEAVLII